MTQNAGLTVAVPAMLTAYVARDTSLDGVVVPENGDIPPHAIWIDLYNPTHAEDRLVERATGIAVPTKEEMQEIEVTSRLYVENGGRYMTASLMCRSDTDAPQTTAVTFILSGHRLVTVRYDEPRPFAIVSGRLARHCPAAATGEVVMMDLLDAIIDRIADILEKVSADIDRVSREIFQSPQAAARALNYMDVLKTISRKGDLTSMVRESLVSVSRVLLYLSNEADSMKWAKDMRAPLKGMQRDVQSLSDYATFLSNKITFLLDALLGVVSLQQNNIIKIFSVVAVVFMPPTLVASIYGMNFRHMPELDWTFGYPLAVALMLAAAALPYLLFRWKRWL